MGLYLDDYFHVLTLFSTGHITVTCLPPVSTTGLSKEDIPRLIESTRSSMIETYDKTSAASDENERKIK